MAEIIEELGVREDDAGARLDVFLHRRRPDLSRSLIQRLIGEGRALVNGLPAKASHRLRIGERVIARMPSREELVPTKVEPVAFALDVLYEDDSIIVVNKPAGLPVHPARPRDVVTLVAGLLHHCGERLSDLGDPLRRGVVHRLDRDTSGVMVAAKTNEAHEHLAEQFRERRVRKKYLAVVRGEVGDDSGEITLPIGRDSRVHDRKVVRHIGGRRAISHYLVKERFRGFTLVELRPRTGRTHQLRVHMSAIGHPVVADRMYGGGKALFLSELQRGEAKSGEKPCVAASPVVPMLSGYHRGASSVVSDDNNPLIARQALHALEITFTHPATGAELTFTAALPADMESLLAALRSAS